MRDGETPITFSQVWIYSLLGESPPSAGQGGCTGEWEGANGEAGNRKVSLCRGGLGCPDPAGCGGARGGLR